MRLNRVWAGPYQELRRVLTIGLTIYGLQAAAERAPRCEAQLGDQTLKIFRADEGYHSTSKGIYVFQRGRTFFGPLDSRELLFSRLENSASHLKIVSDLIGEREFARILESARPEEEFERKIYEEVIKHETRSTLIKAARLKRRFTPMDPSAPLTESDRVDVMDLLASMGRLATPVEAWVQPKLASGAFRQIALGLIDVLIQRVSPPNSFIYKAVRVTVFLDRPRTFFMSAGASGHPDNTHAFLLGALRLILPNDRILASKSGYFSIVPATDGKSAAVQFFEKGHGQPSAIDE